jgi:hypothetical protein
MGPGLGSIQCDLPWLFRDLGEIAYPGKRVRNSCSGGSCPLPASVARLWISSAPLSTRRLVGALTGCVVRSLRRPTTDRDPLIPNG